jgi:hypothetical protein
MIGPRVVGVGAHLLGELVEPLDVVGHAVLRPVVLTDGVLGEEMSERGDRAGREARRTRRCLAAVAGQRSVQSKAVMLGVLAPERQAEAAGGCHVRTVRGDGALLNEPRRRLTGCGNANRQVSSIAPACIWIDLAAALSGRLPARLRSWRQLRT